MDFTNPMLAAIQHTIETTLLPDEAFNGLLDHAVALTRQAVDAEHPESVPDSLLLVKLGASPGELLVIGLEGAGVAGDREALFALGEQCAADGVTPLAIFTVAEGWAVTGDTDDAFPVAPSDAPDRQEVLAIAGLTLDRRTAGCFCPLERGPDGRLAGIGPPIATIYSNRQRPEDDSRLEAALLEAFFYGMSRGVAQRRGPARPRADG